MAKRIIGSTPKADGYRMPAEFEPQDGVWMLWPERNDNWRSGAKPAQETFCQVARAIARFEKVTMCVSAGQYQNARARLPEEIRVVEVVLQRRMGPGLRPHLSGKRTGRPAGGGLDLQRMGRPVRRPVLPVGQGRSGGAEDL